jgi:hypothetical protein
METTMKNSKTSESTPVSLFTPWFLVYIAIAMVASFLILLLAVLIGLKQTELPVLSWFYIGLGGIVADIVMRACMSVRLVAWKSPQLPFIWLWLALVVCAAVVGPSAVNDLLTSLAKR